MATFTFVHVNNSPVAIPDAGAGNVPSLITQSLNVFVGGTIEDLNVSIIGLSHTWASDLDIALFGPNAQNNPVLMSDAVGSGDFTGFPLTFDDSATSGLPDFASPISNGSYRPTNHGISSGNINPDETGAQFGLPSVTLNNPGPTGGATLATAFNGANTAGAWTLGISDDGVDDTGSFFNWSLQIQTAGTATVINGTSGADSLAIASTSATAGDIAFNGAVAGFTGLDTIYFYTGGGADDVTGGQGAETVYDGDALDGDSFNGGAGFDTLDYSNVSFVAAGYSTVFFDLDTGNALSDTNAFDTILNFENLIASDTDDTIDGTFGANYLSGLAGNDDLSGLDGEDILNGGVGNDELTGGLDQDAVFGGIGNDVLWLRDAFDNVAGEVLDGGEDFDTIQTTAIGAYSFDLRDDSLLSIEALRLQTDPGSLGEIGIRAAQINGTELATNLQVTGSTDATVTDRLTIDMTGQVLLDLSNFVMINFDGANDRVIVLASNGPAVAITGTGVADELRGSNNSFDYLFGGNGNDSLYGEAGNDELDGGLGADAFFGGAGDEDWASYSYESEDLVINLSNSALNVGAVAAGDTYLGIEGLIGGSGDDSITGDAAVNYLLGNDGNDTLTGGAGADSIFGGVSGTRDMASYADSGIGLRVDLQVAATNTGIAAGDVFNDIEDLFGSAFSDSLLGDTGANMIWGDLGNDAYLDGRVGNDTIYGGTGNDVMIGGWGADVLDGGAGTRDRVQYTDSAVGLRADIQVATFNTGIALGDVYTGIEDIYGSFHGDTLLGDSGANIIWGDAGNDAWLDGRIGTDTLYGGAGNDVLIGGAGADVLDGGAGTRDRVQYTDSTVGLRADLQVTTFNTGVAMGDTYVGIEDIFGGFQGDTLLGDGGGNMIWGSAGNDLIDGRLGNDTLIGGAGNDTLVGGAGVDVFLFETALGATNRDSITGYSVADDTIQLENAIFTALAATGPLAGTAFVSGTAATTAAHRIIYNSANGQLLYDADGNGAGAAVHFATLTAGLGMAAGEFVVV